MKTIIDFETEYNKQGLSVKDLGNKNYAAASEAYIVSVVRNGKSWCGPIADLFTKAPIEVRPDPSDDVPVAANANFDRAFWEKYFPPFVQEWQCVLDKARVNQLPGDMSKLAGAVLGQKLDKTLRDEMAGQKWADLPPSKQAELTAYCLKDSLTEQLVDEKMPEMSIFEDRLARQTRRLNWNGVAIDVPKLEKYITNLQQVRHATFKEIPWTEWGAPLSPIEFAKWCASKGSTAPTSLAKGDEECAEWARTNPELAPTLAAMREFRRSNTLIEKLKSMKGRTGADGIMPLDLIYCGASHTRRWSCRGVNVQNLDREPVVFTRANLPVEERTVWFRELIIPRPGKVFVILDLAQIEPRCLWWLIDDTKMLDIVRTGFGIYEAHARATMGWTGGKLKDERPDLYRLAKARVLGLGYGCGPDKFQVVAKLMAGLDRTLLECKRDVQDFRASNTKITGFWRSFDEMISCASKKREDLNIEMPTGEALKLWGVSAAMKGGFKAHTVKGDPKEVTHNLWGGVLTENATQRMARDVLADSNLRLEWAGLNPIFHAHDEVILEVDEKSGQEALEEATRIMKTPPDWAPDLPLDVEGGIFKHYTK